MAATDVLRELPIVQIDEMLIGKGFSLSIYDGCVSRAGVIGANRQYIEREIPHIWSLMRNRVDDVVESSDVVVIGNDAAEFREIAPMLNGDHTVIDLVRVFDGRASDEAQYQDRKSTRLNSSHPSISYAVFCLKKKK